MSDVTVVAALKATGGGQGTALTTTIVASQPSLSEDMAEASDERKNKR